MNIVMVRPRSSAGGRYYPPADI